MTSGTITTGTMSVPDTAMTITMARTESLSVRVKRARTIGMGGLTMMDNEYNAALNAAIARRAAEEVVRRANARNVSLRAEVECIGVLRPGFYKWERGRCAPSARVLSHMAGEGYDVIYILTGERKKA